MSASDIYIPKYDLINQNMAIDFRTSGSYVPAHWHSALEITYLIDGQADMTVDGSRHTMVQGEFIVIDAGRIHEYLCPGEYRQLPEDRTSGHVLCDFVAHRYLLCKCAMVVSIADRQEKSSVIPRHPRARRMTVPRARR